MYVKVKKIVESTSATGSVIIDLMADAHADEVDSIFSVQINISAQGSVQPLLSLDNVDADFIPFGQPIIVDTWLSFEQKARYLKISWTGNTGTIKVLLGA